MKLIIGLGNPGEKYIGTRHNLGFEVVDQLIKTMDGGRWKMVVEDSSWKLEKKFKSEVLKTGDLLLVKPQTYMNNSGMAVKLLATYYKIPTTDVIIIHDDLDLLLGKIKVRIGGAAGGHHGVESIIKELGTDQFIRIRLGIGNQKSHLGEHSRISFNAEHFVTENFLPDEKSKVKSMVKQAITAVETILNKGLKVAQNQYN